MNADRWQFEAVQRLRQHTMRATLAGRDYSPDTKYEQLKRGHCGPHTIALAEILQRWAEMWAQDMRELPYQDAASQWQANMAEADAEVDRYLASHHLTRAA